MLTVLEAFTALAGIRLFMMEAVRYRFQNYATSIFLLCFVPLFCVYPLIARLVVGGAYSVQPGDYLVIDDTPVYLVYQLFCLGVLLMIYLTSGRKIEPPARDWRLSYETSIVEQIILVGIISAGVYLYIRSTGFSASELIAASRFEWFNNASYSPLTFVISSYLFAISPIALLLALHNRKYRWIAFIIVAELVLFGLLSKDRKWLIYIISSGFAALYLSNNFHIVLRRKVVITGVIAIAVLAFWQIARGVLFDYAINGSGDLVYDSQQMAINLMTRGDLPYYYNASITAIHMNINQDFSIPFGLLRRQVFFFLPAGYSFGLKIEDISAIFSDALGAEDSVRRGNMPPGLFGLFVLSFGWIGGVVTCSLIPLLLRVLDRYIRRSKGLGAVALVAHMLSATMLLLRGDDSSATYFVIISLAMLYLVRPAALLRRQAAVV